MCEWINSAQRCRFSSPAGFFPHQLVLTPVCCCSFSHVFYHNEAACFDLHRNVFFDCLHFSFSLLLLFVYHHYWSSFGTAYVSATKAHNPVLVYLMSLHHNIFRICSVWCIEKIRKLLCLCFFPNICLLFSYNFCDTLDITAVMCYKNKEIALSAERKLKGVVVRFVFQSLSP